MKIIAATLTKIPDERSLIINASLTSQYVENSELQYKAAWGLWGLGGTLTDYGNHAVDEMSGSQFIQFSVE